MYARARRASAALFAGRERPAMLVSEEGSPAERRLAVRDGFLAGGEGSVEAALAVVAGHQRVASGALALVEEGEALDSVGCRNTAHSRPTRACLVSNATVVPTQRGHGVAPRGSMGAFARQLKPRIFSRSPPP
jgi:hypothetical protein